MTASRSLLVPGLLLAGLAVTTLLVSLGTFFLSRVEVSRTTSPDGAFTAVVTARRFEAFVPRSPGSGSDKPGFVEIFRADGTSCGRAEVSMVSNGFDVRWETERSPRSAVLVGVATWALDACTVDTTGW